MHYLDFEKPLEQLEYDLENFKKSDTPQNDQIIKLENNKKALEKKIFNSLTAWQKVQIARHPDRPHTIDYIENIFSDFLYLSGDRKFADDNAIIGGLGKLDGKSCLVLGTEKGRTMETRLKHNFGMAKPEGYRKAQRLFKFAEKFNLPIITFVDTAGAFPGKEAEERGQSESIAQTIFTNLKIKTPIISVIIGEGGSGGAIALATADVVLMLENSIYSVISPEGCASILWRDTNASQIAAKSLRLTAEDCLSLKVIDKIISENLVGAHRKRSETILNVKNSIKENLSYLNQFDKNTLLNNRNEKYLNITSD